MTVTLENLIPIDIDRRLLYIGWLDLRLFTTSAEFCDSLVATGGHGFALTLLQNCEIIACGKRSANVEVFAHLVAPMQCVTH